MDEFSENPSAVSTTRKRKSYYEPKSKICSNCCQTCYGPRKKSQSQNPNPNSDYNCIEDDDDLYEMLAVIYKLNYVSSSSSSADDQMLINKSSLTLCSACTRLLHKFYPLFSQFNQLRQLDSQLAKGIKAVDKILISHQFNNNNSNSGKNNSNFSSELKHDGFSPADGPWVKIGKRLEQMEFQEIEYKPRKTHESSRSQIIIKQLSSLAVEKKEKQIEELPIEIPGDHDNHDENDNNDDDWLPDEIDKQVDVKLFSEPISDSIVDKLLFHDDEINEVSVSEKELKSESKSTKKVTSKVESDFDEEQEEEEAENDNDDDHDDEYSPKPKPKQRERPRGKKQDQKPSRRREKKGRPQKYKTRTNPPIKTDRRNERRRQRYHKNRDLALSGYKPPPEPEEDLKCAVYTCGLEFKKASELKLHERKVHTKDGPYLCNLPLNNGVGPPCPSTFPTLFLLKRHQQTSKHVMPDEQSKVKCEECGKILMNRLVYNIHIYRLHTEAGRKVYEEEQKRLAEKQKKQRAEERQLLLQKGFYCDICQVDFQTKIKLTNHKIAVHEDYGKRYKPYVCEICGKKCVGLYRLNQHVTIVHSDERPVICALCGRRYKTEGHLKGHMKTGHDEEGRKKYNAYMRESNRRRKELAEALARKALENQQGENPNPNQQEQQENQQQQEQQEHQQQQLQLPLPLLPSSSSSSSAEQQHQISIGESLLLNMSNPMMDFTFTAVP